ncbi:hypothetical protein FSP39_002857 [Pinctada imbricata]|uniref:G-protein coupled receptors family 1 profile domain-containing protein n=1 Tax=Pinctada imbricata TaxID=66713 RepID=A0AA88YHH0_PINIB|nr:hypothetical protein FSP39_002857 [Pinctada imbricata]
MEIYIGSTEHSVLNFSTNETFSNPCVEKKDGHEDFYNLAQLITGLIIYPIVCFFGVIGNTLSLIVLSHRDMATSTNVYLSALAISDTIKLINDIFYFLCVLLLRTGNDDDKKIITSFYPFAHYIFNMSVCVTAWLTISVASERYIAVCIPTKAKEMCTIARARFVSTFVFVFMILVSIPYALRYKSVETHVPEFNTTCYTVQPGILGMDEFMTPYTWVQNMLRSVIPFFILIFLSSSIIHVLRKQRVKGKKFSSRNRITLMLVAVVIFFVVCIMPDALLSLFFGFGYIDENNFNRGIREITDSLLAINSAFNFVLYCTMSKIFRQTFRKIFCKNFTKLEFQGASERLMAHGENGVSVAMRESHSGNNNRDKNRETFV